MPKNVMCKKCNNLINGWCEKKIDSPDPNMVRDCQYFWEKTNADRIRAMSDEELCSVVRLAAYADVCYMGCECHECVFHGLCKEDEYEMCSDEQEEITTVMKWLKQPAE